MCICIGIIDIHAQVSIGNTNPQAAFEVESISSGILIPRVTLTATNVQAPVVNPTGGALQESTLVYNTNTAGTSPNNVYPGYYYWQNNEWYRLTNYKKNDWVFLASDESITSTTFVDVPNMSITFTAISDEVTIHFDGGGIAYTNSLSLVNFRVINVGTGTVIPYSYKRTNVQMRDIFYIPAPTNAYEVFSVTVWDLSNSFPMQNLVPGNTYTIQLQASNELVDGTVGITINAGSSPSTQGLKMWVQHN